MLTENRPPRLSPRRRRRSPRAELVSMLSRLDGHMEANDERLEE